MIRNAKHLSTLVALALVLLAQTALAADETIKNPKANSAEATIEAAFKAALKNDFDAYLETIHPEHKETTDQRNQRKSYEWKRFTTQVKWYLVSESPITFVVARRVPEDKYIKIFVKDQKNKDRMPVPVTLKKDGDGWKIQTSSLSRLHFLLL